MKSRIALISLYLILAAHPALAACFDLDKGQPKSLDGLLTFAIFPGPPNYEDVTLGDTPEPTFILRLFQPICLTGDINSDPKATFWDVHLVADNETLSRTSHSLVNSEVHVTLHNQMAAITGHHHAPLVAWVTTISRMQSNNDFEQFLSEYGTGATTVRGFYYALHAGDGASAAQFVVPEKRSAGPLSGSQLTKYYGGLSEPLKLLEMKPIGDGEFFVRYTFKSRSAQCNGSAIVTTLQKNGHNLISRIHSLSGC